MQLLATLDVPGGVKRGSFSGHHGLDGVPLVNHGVVLLSQVRQDVSLGVGEQVVVEVVGR